MSKKLKTFNLKHQTVRLAKIKNYSIQDHAISQHIQIIKQKIHPYQMAN